MRCAGQRASLVVGVGADQTPPVGIGTSTVSDDLSPLPQGCQHNTEGDHCERCQAGFVRTGSEDPTAPCASCPCPLAVPSNK